MDQAHEKVADVRAVPRLVEERVLPMENSLLQGPFADIVVEGCARLSQEERERRPVVEEVRDRLAEAGERGDSPQRALSMTLGHRATEVELIKEHRVKSRRWSDCAWPRESGHAGGRPPLATAAPGAIEASHRGATSSDSGSPSTFPRLAPMPSPSRQQLPSVMPKIVMAG